VEAKGTHLGPEIAGKEVAAVDLVRTGRDLVLRKLSDGFADGLGGLAEVEVELAGGVRDGRSSGSLEERYSKVHRVVRQGRGRLHPRVQPRIRSLQAAMGYF
jgi:hypothetical protein